LDESTFDTFGDFGEFQSGSGSVGSVVIDGGSVVIDSELTPTGDSWTFASASSSSTSTSEDLSEGDIRTGSVSESSP
jgi:serine/threonine-protein phosphatase 6 regulatory subunit 3